MADYVSVANLAASKLGEDDQIRSPDDDTHVGRTIKAVWDMVRRAAIRDHSWNFATKRDALPKQVTTEVIHPWTARFPLPADSLRLIEVLGFRVRSQYQLEGKAILCNSEGPVYVRYLVDRPQVALWDDMFVESFACRLAFQIGPRIVGGAFDKDAAWKVYQASLNEAKRVDARENPQVAWEPTEWETARMGYCPSYGSGGGGWGA